MLRQTLIVTATLISICSAPAASAREGAYFAFSLGQSQTETNNTSYASIGYSALLGVQFDPNVALEIEYINHGEMDDDQNNKIAASSRSLWLVLLEPLSPYTSLYVKIGGAQVNSVMSGTSLTGISNSLSSVPYGLGLQYELSRNTTLRLFAESGYNYQVNGTTGTVATTTYNFSGGIYRIGLASMYAF